MPTWPWIIYVLIVFYIHAISCVYGTREKPNIVLIIADDLGWSDVGFTKKQADNTPDSPTLDGLAKDGIIFENLYTQSLCTPTRASLLTGKYPHRLGLLFSSSVVFYEDEGLGPKHRFLSEDLSDRNYKVHGIGKWHLGFRKQFLPLNRGFDSFYGAYSGSTDYFTHRSLYIKDGKFTVFADSHYDFKEDLEILYSDISNDTNGIHATDLYTEAAVKRIQEHQARYPLFLYLSYTAPHSKLQPDEDIVKKRNSHIKDTARRRYAAMVTQLDNGVARLVEALKQRNMWNNTLLLFFSDHGASVMRDCWDTVGGSNMPYRDGKGSYFEGGIKSAAFVWSPWLRERGVTSSALLHVVDIYPFLLAAADDKLTGTVSMMFEERNTIPGSDTTGTTGTTGSDSGNYLIDVLNGNNPNGRDTILHSLVGDVPADKSYHYCSQKFGKPANYAVIRHKNYKLFYGSLQDWCRADYLHTPCTDILESSLAEGSVPEDVLLFDIDLDPGETRNVAHAHIHIVREMIGMLEVYRQDAVQTWM